MMLQDDRIKYEMGKEVKDPMQETINNLMNLGISKKEIDIIRNNTVDSDAVRKIIVRTEKDMGVEPGNLFEAINMIAKKKEEREGMKDGGEFPDLNKDGEVTYADVLKGRGVFQEGGPTGKRIVGITDDGKYYLTNYGDGNILVKNAPEELVKKWKEAGKPGTPKMKKAEGGSIDDQMVMIMTPPIESEMESDDDMEDGYTKFIMEEALTEDEEDMLMSKLEQDEELAMLFDKVIDVAQEFAGAGPVEGPGSGVSDSIPARLSDGEFVFTAKAVEEIGSDNLMSMMKEAEAKADERLQAQDGGMIEEEEEVIFQTGQEPVEQVINVRKETVAPNGLRTEEDEITKNLKLNMLDPNKRYVRS